MRFWLAALHFPRYRDISGHAYARPKQGPAVIQVDCPTCGLDYAAELEPGVDAWELESCESKATVRLGLECPDHPHRFVVEL